MLGYGLDHQKESVFPFLVLFMKFGVSMAFNITYVCHSGCFPTLFASSSFGYCQFICRFFTAFTPMVAQVSQRASMVLFAVSSSLGALILQGLIDIDGDDEEYKYEAPSGIDALSKERKKQD